MNLKESNFSPLSSIQQELIEQLIASLSEYQLLWFNGYLTGLTLGGTHIAHNVSVADKIESVEPSEFIVKPTAVNTSDLKIFYGTHSGNSKEIAHWASEIAGSLNISNKVINLSDYNSRNLKNEKNILIIISTQGEGEPPLAAEIFYNNLINSKSLQLNDLHFGVIALGDSSYKQFCKTGVEIDKKLSELGAKRVHEILKCDLDFESSAKNWLQKVLPHFSSLVPKTEQSVVVAAVQEKSNESKIFSKRNPYSALLLDRINLNGKGSLKETYHVELSLENSGLIYEPGDALGVYSKNSENLVDSIIENLKFNADHSVLVNNETKTLRNALINHYEITVLTPVVLENFAKLSNNQELIELIGNELLLDKYIYGRDILDFIQDYPAIYSVEDFLTSLRKLPPRLYSIASSQLANPDEVHLTVSAVKYIKNNRLHEGVCSNFISSQAEVESNLQVFIDKNESFRLPNDSDLPIIMIGPGTGVAPFRAFLQHREALGASGKNWLFFGDQHFTTDFLYQEEWLRFKKSGLLTNLDVAFSRDQDDKVYVQHKMYQKSKEIFNWIEEGAIIYICGDKLNMAKDVKRALFNIISKEGGHTDESASAYFDSLKKNKRILEDVY
ncbi:MAG: assimilatory sulfite reductase (NADPH) flavoprotein subunit [Bacteroidales bacterium]|nr:assimilatory sulfite reductase (NADPH) flavoprotein subunit [Bacteroidales bacterium]